MKKVCVITGGGSGMGLATAKCMPKDKVIVVTGRTLSKLENAVKELNELGYEAYAKTCDTSNREQVRELAEYAASLGEITNVINSAGLSPAMAEPEKLIRVNALGTVYVNQEFAKLMKAGSAIVDISSNSAYILPGFLANEKTFALAETDEEKFVKKILSLPNKLKGYKASGLAYGLSKKFVIWYAAKSAYALGEKGIRVCSLSPGLISTDMGALEAEEGGSLIETTAEKRMGKAEELGFAIASVADERNGYLAGVDVLVDGGSVIGKKFVKKN
ncbi:MAG: SDR family NAD(P)-dependent oxidoreductase [Clostridia bacterium]|nr:SDR family NAD(P)-dependent oxidoreductase [Clostridia bacterium]